MSPKVEVVHWVDAVSSDGWYPLASYDEPHHVSTIGFVVADTDTALVIAATYGEGQTNNRISIPKGWIRSRRVIDIAKGEGQTPRDHRHSQGVKKRVRE